MRVRGALAAFLHQAILKALKEHPEGISPAYFNNMESEGVDLSDPSCRSRSRSRNEGLKCTYLPHGPLTVCDAISLP